MVRPAVDRRYDPLRSAPHFQDVLFRMNLATNVTADHI